MLTLIAVEAVAIVLLGTLVLGLLRSHAEILRRLHSMGAGLDPDAESAIALREPGARLSNATASDVSGTTVDGDPVSVGVVGARHDTLLAFLTTGCQTCAGFWEAFADGRHLSVPGGARLVVVVKDPDLESPARVAELAPPDVPVIQSTEAWLTYHVPVAPYFVYVDGPSGRALGEGAGHTWEQVSSLLSQSLADARTSTRVPRWRPPDTGPPPAPATDRSAEARADRELAQAGIFPGHPSLHRGGSPPPPPPSPDEQA